MTPDTITLNGKTYNLINVKEGEVARLKDVVYMLEEIPLQPLKKEKCGCEYSCSHNHQVHTECIQSAYSSDNPLKEEEYPKVFEDYLKEFAGKLKHKIQQEYDNSGDLFFPSDINFYIDEIFIELAKKLRGEKE